jgi:hypothetical protein
LDEDEVIVFDTKEGALLDKFANIKKIHFQQIGYHA